MENSETAVVLDNFCYIIFTHIMFLQVNYSTQPNSTWRSAIAMALTTTVPVTAEDLLHLPARITFGTWTSDWTLLSLQGRERGRETEWEGDRDRGRCVQNYKHTGKVNKKTV